MPKSKSTSKRSPSYDCERVIYRLIGTGLGMLQHATYGMAFAAEVVGGMPHDKFIPLAEFEREVNCYRMANGCLFVPATNIQGLLKQELHGLQWPVAALEFKVISEDGKEIIVKGARARMAKALSVILGGTSIQHEQMPLFDPDTFKPITEYETGLHAAKVGPYNGKVTIMRARAFIPRWAIDLVMDVNQRVLGSSMDALLTTFEDGGVRCGLCDQRPGSPISPGAYGTFRVEQVTQAEHDRVMKIHNKCMTPALTKQINAKREEILQQGREQLQALVASKAARDASKRVRAEKKTTTTTKKTTTKKAVSTHASTNGAAKRVTKKKTVDRLATV